MKVTLIIEDSGGGGLEISGAGGGLSGAQPYRGSNAGSTQTTGQSAGAYDGGAGTSIAAAGSGAAPAPFMGQNVQPFVSLPGATDIAAGAAPGAAQMNAAMAVDQSFATYGEPPERSGVGRSRRAPQRRRTRRAAKRAR